MSSKNPYGSPPRDPGPSGHHGHHGIEWYGERWYVVDAVDAVGIHLNTYGLRRRRGLTVKESLVPPSLKNWKPKKATPIPMMPTRLQLTMMVRELTARVEALETQMMPTEKAA